MNTPYGNGDPTPGWNPLPPNQQQNGLTLKNWAWIVHGLYAATFVTGITSLPGVIVAYFKMAEARGTPYESHFIYAIRTFWIGLGLGGLATVLCLTVIGIPFGAAIFCLLAVWWIIRMIRPIMALSDNRPVAAPYAFF